MSTGPSQKIASATHLQAESVPDTDHMRRWLTSNAVVAADGSTFSWSNPSHQGYPYPEAAGLLLSTLSTTPDVGEESRAVADRIASWLCRCIGADGGVGRDGITYLFDSSVALAGLLRYRAAGGREGGDDPIHRLAAFVGACAAAGTSVSPIHAASDGRWSTQFGAHLVKCLHSLHLYATTFGRPVREELVATLIDRSGRQPSPVYVHPFCYEQEGHVIAASYHLTRLFEPIDGALEWLAAVQRRDGALLAFANGLERFGEARSDATAQAVRLWLLRDRDRYADAIARALAFLASCQTSEGGILYTPERDDVCTWSTIFTLQAVEWFRDRPRLDELS